MEQLPASLLYFTSQLQNFVRNTVKLNTLNTQTLASNGATQLRVALPVNAVASMKSLSMYCDMSTKGRAASGGQVAVNALIPRNGPIACFDRVSVSAGGIALDNGVTPYHVVYQMRQNLLSGNQKVMSDDKVLQQSVLRSETGALGQTANYPAGHNAADTEDLSQQGQKQSFIVNNFAGFTECHPEYLDLSLLPQVFVTIQIANASVLPLQQASTNLGDDITSTLTDGMSYALKNIHFTLDVCQIGSGMYSALTERVLAERGSIDIPYPQFTIFRQDSSSASSSIRGSVSCMSLDRVTGFMRNTDGPTSYQLNQIPVKAEDAVGSKFSNHADTFISQGVRDYQLTINNSPIPTYRPTPLQAFNYVVCADDRTYSRSRGGSVASQPQWLNNCWCAHHRLCFDNDISRISGTNVSSVNAQISFQTYGDGTGNADKSREVAVMTEQTSILRCGAGRSCAVVA